MNSYIAGNYKTLSNTISQVVPAVILENTNFEDLFSAYYKFTEQSGQFYKESKILFDSFNYSNADEKYLKIFKEQLLRKFPDNGQIALEYFLKFSKVFYKSKGSEESYKFLFKVLYDADVEITYPSDYILKSSDGEWIKRNLVKIENFFDVNENGIIDFQELIVGKTLTGITSNTTAFISDIVSYDTNMLELHIEMINGNFEIDEVVHILYPDNKYSVSRILPSIGSYKIIDGGIGYLANKALQFKTFGDGFNFSVSIDSVNPINGQILSLNIKNSGYNYLYQMPVLDLTDFLLFDNDNYTDYIPKYGPKEFYFGYNDFKLEHSYNSANYNSAVYSYSSGNEIILDKNTNSFVYGSTKIGYGSYNGFLDSNSLYYSSNNLYGPKSFYNVSNSTIISGYQYGTPEYGNAYYNIKYDSIPIEPIPDNYIYEPPWLNPEFKNMPIYYCSYENSIKMEKRFAKIEFYNVAVYTESGFYKKKKSLLSDKWKLFDGNYYQDYSYVINTKLNFDVFKNDVEELVHPAGTKMFYNKLQSENITIQLNSNISLEVFYEKDNRTKYIEEFAYDSSYYTSVDKPKDLIKTVYYDGTIKYDGLSEYADPNTLLL